MIRSSKHILKFQTEKKSNYLERMIEDFRFDVLNYIQLICSGILPLTNLVPSSKILPNGIIPFGSYKQIIYNHASAIIRSQIKRAEKRRYKRYKDLYFKYMKAEKQNNFTSKRYSELRLNPIHRTKYFTVPDLKNISINLDQRFVNVTTNSKHFDEFISITTPYLKEGYKNHKIKIKIPINHHAHSNKFKDWTRKKTIRLRKENDKYFIDLIYEKEDPITKNYGKTLGIDQGYKKLLSCSDGQILGSELFDLYDRISKKVQKSKSFKRLLIHRDNEINRICNLLNLDEVKTLIIEDLKNLKNKSKLFHTVMNKVQRWSYPKTAIKLERLCEENGIHLIKVNPAYTSQTCSNCGTVDKTSRNGEEFSCQHCGYLIDADLNASINILRLGVYSPQCSENFKGN